MVQFGLLHLGAFFEGTLFALGSQGKRKLVTFH